jgi:hypothetical protein
MVKMQRVMGEITNVRFRLTGFQMHKHRAIRNFLSMQFGQGKGQELVPFDTQNPSRKGVRRALKTIRFYPWRSKGRAHPTTHNR